MRGAGAVGSAVRPLVRDDKQKLVSVGVVERKVAKQPKHRRQKATNGWQPVGLPFQKKVFSVVGGGLLTRRVDPRLLYFIGGRAGAG